MSIRHHKCVDDIRVPCAVTNLHFLQVTFAELKVTTRSYLTEVYEFSVPAYQIDRLYEIFLRYKDHFMDTYFLPTVHLLKKLKVIL